MILGVFCNLPRLLLPQNFKFKWPAHDQFAFSSLKDKFKQIQTNSSYHNIMFKTNQLSSQGKKPFGCKICKTRFTQKYNLKRHQLTIHGVCIDSILPNRMTFSAIFKSLNPIKLIQVKWTFPYLEQEKKFKCGTCVQSFRTKLALRQHNLVIHPVKSSAHQEDAEFWF